VNDDRRRGLEQFVFDRLNLRKVMHDAENDSIWAGQVEKMGLISIAQTPPCSDVQSLSLDQRMVGHPAPPLQWAAL
jgi:hypothetical protein